MALEALNDRPEDHMNAAFMRNHHGKVCIAFSDPSYVRADSILVDTDHLCVYAVLHESAHLIGHVSEGMAQALESNERALLTAMTGHGGVVELEAPIRVSRKH